MKKIYAIILSLGVLMSCDDYDLEDQGFILQDLPGYVAFNAPGTSVNLSDVSVAEDDGSASFEVENPTGSLSDITVSYTLSGSAVFGVDYTIAGASASGGQVLLPINDGDVNTLIHGDIEITLLTDDVVDGDKTLTITLTNAVNESGETFAVGRGGLDILRNATVIISDID